MTGALSEKKPVSGAVHKESKSGSRVRFQKVPTELPLHKCPPPICSASRTLTSVEFLTYGAVERATPTQQVSSWLSRTSSFELGATMPSFKTLLQRSRSRNEMGASKADKSSPGLSSPPGKPEMKRDFSCRSLLGFGLSGSSSKEKKCEVSIRKCETVLSLSNLAGSGSAKVSLLKSNDRTTSMSRLASRASFLGGSSGHLEPMKPVNRLRVNAGSKMCSRCSSILSLSRASLAAAEETSEFVSALCKLCLVDVDVKNMHEIQACQCTFCKECMQSYVEFEIQEGAYEISCPDAQCERQGVMSMAEIESLVGKQLLEKHRKFRLNREVDLDTCRTWCPRAGCETICDVCPKEKCSPQNVHCPTCETEFCSNCKGSWHGGLSCEESSQQEGFPFNLESIKCCPVCHVPIEKDAGCAQMMCKRCKHVFCWYCLASLDDDFLLRHYDKGPCKNKLGHTRASVIWHRTQVIGIFAGFGILLLVASPLLLLAAPCIVCCKCRVCSNKFDEELEEDVSGAT